jgi:hypothetical protein
MKEGEKPKKTKPVSRKTDKKVVESPKTVLSFHVCSFCGLLPIDQRLCIAEPNNIFICEDCAEICVSIFTQQSKEKWTQRLLGVISNPDKYDLSKQEKSSKPKKGANKI